MINYSELTLLDWLFQEKILEVPFRACRHDINVLDVTNEPTE